MRPGRARVTRQKSRERGESRRAFRDGIRREVGLEQTMSDVLFWVVLQLRVRRRASRVSRVLHFGVWTLGLGQSSACLQMDVEKWLGDYYTDSDGSEVALPDAVKVILAKAFKDGVLDVKQDILDDAVELPPKRMKQLVEIFQIAYKDVVLAADQKLMHSARIDRWLRARYSEDEDEASSTMDGKSKAQGLSRSPAKSVTAVLSCFLRFSRISAKSSGESV
jgi:hypothetical protein